MCDVKYVPLDGLRNVLHEQAVEYLCVFRIPGIEGG